MSSLSDIKRRLVSVKQTRQITGAMETVSISKMRKALEVYDGSRAYSQMIDDVMRALISADGMTEVDHIETDKRLVFILSSDRGLCGGFDHDIFKLADGYIAEDDIVVPIGRVACEHYRSRNGVDTSMSGNVRDRKLAQTIAQYALDMYDSSVKSVAVIYTELVTHAKWRPVVKQILPVEIENLSVSEAKKEMAFEPDASTVYKTALPLYVTSKFYDAFVNNNAAEHSARRAAMSSATESADKLIASLSVEYNRARQKSVTDQIIEIIGSNRALNQDGGSNEKRP